jgi:hypothetical protein
MTGSSIYGASKQAGAATDAAKLSTDAANHAADVQAQSNREALAFEREQADYQAQQTEINRKANYDQWAAHMQGVNSIGDFLHLGRKPIPAYVPGEPAGFAPTAAAPAGPGAPGAPGPMPANFGAMLAQPRPQAAQAAPLGFASSMPPPYRTFGQYLGA